MSNKKEITVDASAFGDSFVGFKFFVERAEYTSRAIGPPIVHLQVLGVVDSDRSGLPPRDVLQAEFEKTLDAAKNGDGSAMKRLLPLAEACVRANKAPAMTAREQEILDALNGGHSGHGDGFQVRVDTALANNALKSAAELYGKIRPGDVAGTSAGDFTAEQASRPLKTSVPDGVSIHHDLERRFTIAYRISANGKLALVGIAYCSPQDQFCRRTGRELAISRLEQRPCRVVKLPRVMAPGTDDYPKNGAEWRAVEQSILLGLGLLR